MKDSRSVTCNNCNWTHFTVSEEYIKNWEAEWLHYFNTWPKETLALYGITDAPPSIDLYLSCFNCAGSRQNFRNSTQDDLAKCYGSTTQPILDPLIGWQLELFP